MPTPSKLRPSLDPILILISNLPDHVHRHLSHGTSALAQLARRSYWDTFASPSRQNIDRLHELLSLLSMEAHENETTATRTGRG